ncbi:hypothetical protein [Reichenbachiella sp. MALMAid0571]|uniref:hypothetical protein n=1 Tax=Reichenbachiella sp. MALMAid0571 TaxID=3143939 RepID=UPI0032DEE888
MRKIWLFNKSIDLLVLLLPVWVVWAVCFLLSDGLLQMELPLWVWVVFVLGIDVSHVWSTIFRTYLDKEEFTNHKKLLILSPILCFVVFFLVANVSVNWFWTILAYVALYHFIKQQYGFMQLYRAKFGFLNLKKRLSDKLIIYLGMLYPVWYWHLNSDRKFSWFVDGDFFSLKSMLEILPFWQDGYLSVVNLSCNLAYFAFLSFWLLEEVYLHQKGKHKFPIGKWLWIITTWGNWYLGIVYFNSDLVFTLTNVVAHGLPYMALVFFYVEKKREMKFSKAPYFENFYRVGFMVIAVLVLAFGEEYFWDMWLYQDNTAFFQTLLKYPMKMVQDPMVQALVLALLSVPQATHYVLDGFIWKSNHKNPYIKSVLLN